MTKDKPEDEDVIVFDQGNCHRSTAVRLLDNPGRPSDQGRANPYTVKRRPRRRRPYLDKRTGETVYRLRGGKYVTPIYPEWKPDGLIRRPLAFWHPTPNGGRTLWWGDYPRGWSADDDGARPYLMRTVADLALAGADVGGCNTPGAVAYAARAVKANRWASDQACFEAASIGPHLERAPSPDERAKLIYRLEMEDAERKRDAGKRRAKTSEFRDEKTGEYGAVSTVWPNGFVAFAPGRDQPVVMKRSPDDVQDDERLTTHPGQPRFTEFKPDKGDALIEAALRGDPDAWSGKKVKAIQAAPPRRKPGPKPKFGVTMDPAMRKAKERAEERGIPFVIEEYLKARRTKIDVIKASPPPAGGEQEHGHDIGTKHQGHPRGLDSESSSDAQPETAG